MGSKDGSLRALYYSAYLWYRPHRPAAEAVRAKAPAEVLHLLNRTAGLCSIAPIHSSIDPPWTRGSCLAAGLIG